MNKQINVMFPGTFDPIHEGHIDIIKRCSKLFDNVYVVVSLNKYKPNAKSLKERFTKVKATVDNLHLKNVIVNANEGLTVDFANKNNISIIIRSIRNDKDATYEIDMAKTNNKLSNKIETLLMLPSQDLINLSSTAIRYLQDIKKDKK